MGKISEVMHGLKPVILMVLVQIIYAVSNVLLKFSSNDGMSMKIAVAYRFIFASALLVPVAFLVERKKRPKLTWKILIQAFFCGLFGGSMFNNMYAASLVLTSATFVSAMTNLSPAITFILAILFRLETPNLRSIAGKAKVIGTLAGIGGAMILTFYKGVEIEIFPTHLHLLQKHGGQVVSSSHDSSHYILGVFLGLGSCFCISIWLIIEAKMSAKYPYFYSSSALMCVMGAIQSVVFALCTEKDWSQWKLGSNIRLVTALYLGFIGTALLLCMITRCVEMKGPSYVSNFSPLVLILVAIAGALIIDEKLHLGSVIGGILIVCSLYIVVWAKEKEAQKSFATDGVTPDKSVEIEIVENIHKDDDVNQDSYAGKEEDGYTNEDKQSNNEVELDQAQDKAQDKASPKRTNHQALSPKLEFDIYTNRSTKD